MQAWGHGVVIFVGHTGNSSAKRFVLGSCTRSLGRYFCGSHRGEGFSQEICARFMYKITGSLFLWVTQGRVWPRDLCWVHVQDHGVVIFVGHTGKGLAKRSVLGSCTRSRGRYFCGSHRGEGFSQEICARFMYKITGLSFCGSHG